MVKKKEGKRLNAFKEKNRILSFRKPSFVFVFVDFSFCFLINDVEAYFTFYHVIGLADLPSLPLANLRGLACKGELIFMGPFYTTAQITFIATLLLFTVFAINLTREVLNSLHFVILQIRMEKNI